MATGCPNCGYENPLGSRFCSSCGTQLRGSSVDEATMAHSPMSDDGPGVDEDELADLPEGAIGAFVVRQGAKKGSKIALETEEVSIGRHPDSDIFLDDVTVSRRHAIVRHTEAGFTVEDAGSLNGTYVNQERVEQATLSDEDEVQVGKFKLVYRSLGPRG